MRYSWPFLARDQLKNFRSNASPQAAEQTFLVRAFVSVDLKNMRLAEEHYAQLTQQLDSPLATDLLGTEKLGSTIGCMNEAAVV